MASLARQNIWVAIEAVAERLARDLIEALPLRWRHHFGVRRWVIMKNGGETTSRDMKPVALSLPANEILVRRIELPLISRFQLPALMRFEVIRHVPLPLDQVRLDFRVVHRDFVTSRMLVELAIIRAEAIMAAAQQAAAAGVKPAAVMISTEHGPWFARRPLARTWRDVLFTPRSRRVFLDVAILSFGVIALILAAQSWASRLASNREALLLTTSRQAAGIEPLRQQLEALNEKLTVLGNARSRPSTAAITEEVAKLLPDDAWLQELDIEDKSVRLVGTAHHATDLLRILSQSKLFENVEFEAPLTQAAGSDADQFDIVMSRY